MKSFIYNENFRNIMLDYICKKMYVNSYKFTMQTRLGQQTWFVLKSNFEFDMKKISYLDLIDDSHSLDAIKQRPRRPISVLLDNVRSLYNVGSIFRTSDAAGVSKLYLCGITGKPPRAEIHKAALGAEKSVPWEYFENPVEIIQKLKNEGWHIIILEHTDQPRLYHKANYEFPLCLVVGHEITGVSDEVIELADLAIEIPMFGIKQSLNVAVAYGIAIYEIVNQIDY